MPDSVQLEDLADILRRQRKLSNRSARWMMAIIAMMMAVMAVVEYFLAPTGKSRTVIAVSLGGVALLAYLMRPNQPRKWGSPLMIAAVVVFASWAVYTYGSVRSTTILAYFGAVVMAGTHLSLRAMWTTTAAGVLVLGGFTWAQAQGHLVKPELAPDVRFWLMGCVSMAVIGSMLHHTRRATEAAHQLQLSQMEDRLRLEHERDQSHRRFKRIFRLNPTAMLIQCASSRTVQDVNPAFERSFGSRADQWVGQPAAMLWADETQWKAHCRRLFEQRRTGWQDALWRRSDGQLVEVRVSSELNDDPSGLRMLTTVMDVSDETGASGLLSAESASPS